MESEISTSVHRLHMARVNYFQPRNKAYVPEDVVDVYAYLVITRSDVLLVDTGVGEGNSSIERRFAPRRTCITRQLARFGVLTTDVNLIVNSHLHFDHCGNNHLFPNAEIFIQKRELEIAHAPRYNPHGCTRPIKNYTVIEWFDYDGARLNSVSGDLRLS